jgi:hypothetical protein
VSLSAPRRRLVAAPKRGRCPRPRILADGMAAARARFEAMKQVKAAQAAQDRAAAEKKAEAERQAKPKDRGQGYSR